MNLENVTVVTTPLTNSIQIVRVGKDKQLALDKRNAEPEVMKAVIDFMMSGCPNGASKLYTFNGEQWYDLTVKPAPNPIKSG